jgi:hypothetical protein
MSIRSDLLVAITERCVVQLRYHSDAQDRIVHPHVLYRTGTGKECVDSYQIAGPTYSGRLPDWRPFDLAKIRRLELLGEHFSAAPGYSPRSRKYKEGIIARID